MIRSIRSRTTVFVHDLLMIPVAWLLAYWLRFNLETIPDDFWTLAWQYLPVVLLVQVSFFGFFGLYRGVWRFSSLPDLVRITKAVASGMVVIACLLFLYNRLAGVPRAVLPLYALCLLALLCVPRMAYRFIKERAFISRQGQRALIIGAGAAGEMLVRDCLANADSGIWPVAFVDDDAGKFKREIRGLSVVGSVSQLPQVIAQWQIQLLLIAVPSASGAQMQRIVETCEASGLPFQTLPSVKEVLSGTVGQAQLRHVSIDDLLGRAPVQLDWVAMRQHLQGKTLLVTGGGGSIGAELCLQLAKLQPQQLIVLDQCEFNLYRIDAALRRDYPLLSHHAVLGSVCDAACVERVLARFQPAIIFHAAAYKHVPLLEYQVRQALQNNVIGTLTLAKAAIAAGVERMVLISTDKAVNPANVMGASKRAAEMVCQALQQQGRTQFITVRFGNVLDSAGSVVPLFRQQIAAGGPVTVTHPDISRYFMTIPEACQLIMQAETIGQGGEVFVLDMGEPIKITYLAEQMIRLSGQSVAIEFVGLRPGEKLYEELFHADEALQETGYRKLRLAKARQQANDAVLLAIEALAVACQQEDETALLRQLKQLVPEFVLAHD